VSPVRFEPGSYIPEDDILHSHRRESINAVLQGFVLKVSGTWKISNDLYLNGPPLWSSSSWLLTQRSWVRFPALPNFLSNSGSRMGSTQPREDK
jgi:hypothetical protein